eukprot:1333347-Amorphochlora_amoeboformis.AAC.2
MANERFIEFPPTFQPEAWSVPDSSRGQMDGEYGRMRPNMPPRPSSHAGVRVGAQMHVGKQDMIRGGGPGRWAADSRMGVPDEYVRGQNKFYRSSGSDMQDRGVGYGAQVRENCQFSLLVLPGIAVGFYPFLLSFANNFQGIPGVQKESMQQHWNQALSIATGRHANAAGSSRVRHGSKRKSPDNATDPSLTAKSFLPSPISTRRTLFCTTHLTLVHLKQAAMANIRRGRTGRARASKKTQWIDRTGKQVEAPSYDMPNQPSRVQGPPHGGDKPFR